jgi:hypothetical protein
MILAKGNRKLETSLKELIVQNPNETTILLMEHFENTGINKKVEDVIIQLPEKLHEAIKSGLDIFDIKKVAKILNIKISGKPEQILFSYKIKAGLSEIELRVTALEFLRNSKILNKKIRL